MRHDQPSTVASGKPSNMYNCSLYTTCPVPSVFHEYVVISSWFYTCSLTLVMSRFRITRLPWSPGRGVGNLVIYVTFGLHIQWHIHTLRLQYRPSSSVSGDWVDTMRKVDYLNNASNVSIFRRTDAVVSMYA